MARLPRLTVAGYPHHLIQRGNNGQAIFVAAQDYQTFLSLLDENARKFRVDVHGYVLMSNEFHLLATPATQDGLPLLMQAIGRRYVRYFNQRQGRTGTLWEGRYRSTLLQADRYLFACLVTMDSSPVRAGLAADPGGYPWSSHGHYSGARVDKLITPHPLYWTLGNTPFAREVAYAGLVTAGVSLQEQQLLTDSALRGWAMGEPGFIDELQKRSTRRLTKGRAGRPSKAAGVPHS